MQKEIQKSINDLLGALEQIENGSASFQKIYVACDASLGLRTQIEANLQKTSHKKAIACLQSAKYSLNDELITNTIEALIDNLKKKETGAAVVNVEALFSSPTVVALCEKIGINYHRILAELKIIESALLLILVLDNYTHPKILFTLYIRDMCFILGEIFKKYV